jgi:hypothetical protein
MAKPHDEEPNGKGANVPGLSPGPYGSTPYAQEHGERGCALIICQSGFLKL